MIAVWAVAVAAAAVGTVVLCLSAYQLLLLHGRTLRRLDALDQTLEGLGFEGPSFPTRPFRAGGKFEADNIFGAVVSLDEYQVGDHRFSEDDVNCGFR